MQCQRLSRAEPGSHRVTAPTLTKWCGVLLKNFLLYINRCRVGQGKTIDRKFFL
jgi:hypothetical protein